MKSTVNKEAVSRRTALLQSSVIVGSLYLAPTTLSLLLSSRATAQSELPPSPDSPYSFTNSSNATVRVVWEGLRTDIVGPGDRVIAPATTNRSTGISVTSLSQNRFNFTCPNFPNCSGDVQGGSMAWPIDSCAGQVAIEDCASLAPFMQSTTNRW